MANIKCSLCNGNRNIYERQNSTGMAVVSFLLCPACDAAWVPADLEEKTTRSREEK